MILFLYERKSCHRNVQDGKKISYLKHNKWEQESRLLEHDTCIVGSRVLVDGSTHTFYSFSKFWIWFLLFCIPKK